MQDSSKREPPDLLLSGTTLEDDGMDTSQSSNQVGAIAQASVKESSDNQGAENAADVGDALEDSALQSSRSNISRKQTSVVAEDETEVERHEHLAAAGSAASLCPIDPSSDGTSIVMGRSFSNPIPKVVLIVEDDEGQDHDRSIQSKTILDSSVDAARRSNDASTRDIPYIAYNKPLPAFPGAETQTVKPPTSQPSALLPVDRVSAQTSVWPPDNKDGSRGSTPKLRKGSVRRIKSFGDLVPRSAPIHRQSVAVPSFRLPAPSPPLAMDSEKGISTSVSADDVREKDAYTRPGLLSASTASTIATVRPKLLTKRSSSLGFTRQPSKATLKDEIGELGELGALDEIHAESQTGNRNVSSATAPPNMFSDSITPSAAMALKSLSPEKKRKSSSGFSFIPSFLRSSRSRDTPPSGPTTPAEDPTKRLSPAVTVVPLPPEKVEKDDEVVEDTFSSSRDSEPAQADASNTQDTQLPLAPRPERPAKDLDAPKPAGRRYSIIPSFFRSHSASPAPATTSKQVPTLPVDTPETTAQHSVAEEASSSQVPPSESTPQIPSLDSGLADMTFSSLFDFDKSPKMSATANSNSPARLTPTGGRSRASTRSSINSFSLASLKGSFGIGSGEGMSKSPSRPSSAAGDQDFIKRSSLISMSGSTRAIANFNPDTFPSPAKSPAIDSILNGEKRTRIYRSNSASSVPSRAAMSSSSVSLNTPPTSSAVPAFLKSRSRSSSTVTTRSLTKALREHVPQPGSSGSGFAADGPFYSESGSQTTDTFPSYHIPMESPMDDFAAFDYNPPNTSTRSSYMSSSSAIDTRGRSLDSRSRFSTEAIQSGHSTPSTSALRFSSDSRNSNPTAPSLAELHPPSRPSSRGSGSGNTSANAANVFLQKKLRKRAQTASSTLSSSTPPSSALPFNTVQNENSTSIPSRAGRSNSSSRLSSFFTSPTSFLSTSPAASSAWLTPSQGNSHQNSSLLATLRDDSVRSANSSHLGSPDLSALGADADGWSSTSSLPFTSQLSSSAQVSTFAYNPSPLTSSVYDDNGTEPTGDSQTYKEISPARSLSISPAFGTSPVSGAHRVGRSRSQSLATAITRTKLSTNVEEDDTPESYLWRLKETVSKSEIATQLASVGDAFHSAALSAHLAEFDFHNDPIDVALRKLLLGMQLPRETQQIDRVMEAFAERYNNCNSGLFSSPDQPYILAFSMIMLHTDAFNKSNKNKMTKADYIKNTRIDGISADLLEYIFDNITYTPFIYAEEWVLKSLSGVTNAEFCNFQRDVASGGQKSSSEGPSAALSLSSSSISQKSKIDIYQMIAAGQIARLRVNVGLLVPVKSVVAFFDCSALHNAFTFAHVLEIPAPSRRESDAANLLSPSMESEEGVMKLKVTKVGILDRKEDLTEGGKKASSRKWKSWSVMLTGSQLLLFKDTSISTLIQEYILERAGTMDAPQNEQQRVFLPRLPIFRPDAVLSLNDAVALYDFTYYKYTNVFRLLQPNGRQVLFRANNETDLNSWMSTINYGASFRTAGIRMRGSTGLPTSVFLNPLTELPAHPPFQAQSGGGKFSTTSSISAVSSVATDLPSKPNGDSHEQEPSMLSAQDHASSYTQDTFVFAHSTSSDLRQHAEAAIRRHNSRSDVVRSKVIELEARIKSEQASLAQDLRIVRGLAVLTPFTSASHQRIYQALQPVAKSIKNTRQTIAKLICCRECLCRDLLAAEREILREKQSFAGHHYSEADTNRTKPSLHRPASGPQSIERTQRELGNLKAQGEVSMNPQYSSNLRHGVATEENTPTLAQLQEKSALSTFEALPTPSAIDLSNIFPSSPGKFTNSPIIASPFETVHEEQEDSDTEAAATLLDTEDEYGLGETALSI